MGIGDKHAYTGKPLTTNILLLTRNPYPNIHELLSRYRCKQLVLDASNSVYNAQKWKRLCSDYSIPCHYTASDGAFIFNSE